jgi:hypothetical protein
MDPPHTVLVIVEDHPDGLDADALCGRIAVLLEGDPVESVVYDVGALAHPDLGTVDALARLQLASRRLGCRVRLLHASVELRELLDLTGLAGVVPCLPESAGKASGQPEEREEPLRVEEERDAADPAV